MTTRQTTSEYRREHSGRSGHAYAWMAVILIVVITISSAAVMIVNGIGKSPDPQPPIFPLNDPVSKVFGGAFKVTETERIAAIIRNVQSKAKLVVATLSIDVEIERSRNTEFFFISLGTTTAPSGRATTGVSTTCPWAS